LLLAELVAHFHAFDICRRVEQWSLVERSAFDYDYDDLQLYFGAMKTQIAHG